jgi:alpha-L-fucosidase
MFTQRLQDNSRWPNPIVLKITNARPALTPPKVETSGAKFDRGTGTATLTGRLIDMGNAAALDVGFEYRSIVGLDASDRSIAWQPGPSMRLTAPGSFTLSVPGLSPEGIYEYRAWVKHPLLTINGLEKRLQMN